MTDTNKAAAGEATGPRARRSRASESREGAEIVVSVKDLEKSFHRHDGSIVRAVDSVSVDVREGEFIVLLGPSGCGKTTLLRCIAGLERPDSGEISVHGKMVYSSASALEVPPQKRHLSMIFQSYALWPHMTAYENVAYPLRSRKVPRGDIEDRVLRALKMVGIPELARSHPAQMSGGQQQRVALARSVVAGDRLILFDEPLSNVDAKVREQLRLELLSMQRELGFSALYVTHDQVEAMELAHRIAVMNEGGIAQLGPPRVVYEQPTSRYVANFIGTANEVVGTVARELENDLVLAETDHGEVTATRGAAGVKQGDDVVLIFRPERCRVLADGEDGLNAWEGTVVASLFVGSHTEHVVAVGESHFNLWRADPVVYEEHQPVRIAIEPPDVRALPYAESSID